MAGTNRQVRLKRRPVGEPTTDDFEIVDGTIPEPNDGQVLCRTIYLSLDPYMRGRISGARSYASPVEIGQVIVGATVGEVVESRHVQYKAGDVVAGYGGWQSYFAAADSRVPGPFALRRLEGTQTPISSALGVLGMPGMTAYVGLLDIGRPQPGETVVVSAAAGAVGSAVGQIAKIKGCRAVGVAGSSEKCLHVVKDLGFDACVSYCAADFPGRLKAACPNGIDVYFDNVGGDVFKTVLGLVNVNVRIPLCGAISQYNATEAPSGPSLAPLIGARGTVKGFIVSDHGDRMGEFLRDVATWIREGRLRYREDIVEGLDRAPEAFIGLLRGKNVGKMLVKVGPAPSR